MKHRVFVKAFQPSLLMVTALVGFALLMPGLGYAQEPIKEEGNHSASAGKADTSWWDSLKLEPKQREKVTAIMTEGRQQSHKLQQELQARRKALMEYLHSSGATESHARNLNNAINDLQRQLSEVRLKTWFALRSQLSPAQLQTLRELKQKRRSQGQSHCGSSSSATPQWHGKTQSILTSELNVETGLQ